MGIREFFHIFTSEKYEHLLLWVTRNGDTDAQNNVLADGDFYWLSAF